MTFPLRTKQKQSFGVFYKSFMKESYSLPCFSHPLIIKLVFNVAAFWGANSNPVITGTVDP